MLPMRRTRWLYLLHLLWVIGWLPLPLVAQEAPSVAELHLGQLGVREGLSSGMVYGVAQDQKGYLWMATSEGLNQYDGYRIHNIEHDDRDSLSLPEDHVTNVFVDSRNWLWLTTQFAGIHVMDVSNENVIPLGIDQSGGIIKEDPWGNIWLKSSKNPYQILQIPPEVKSPTDLLKLNEPLPRHLPHQVFKGLPKEQVLNSLLFSQKDGLWFIHADTLFNYQLDHSRKLARLQLAVSLEGRIDVDVQKRASGLRRADNVFKHRQYLIEDEAGNRLLLFGKSSICQIDPQTGSLQAIFQLPPPIENLHPRTVDRRGRVWCMDGYDIYLFDPRQRKLVQVARQGYEEQLLKFDVSDIQEDRHGVIWLSSFGYGLYKHTPSQAAFQYYGNDHEGPSMRELEELPNRQLLFNGSDILHLETKELSKLQGSDTLRLGTVLSVTTALDEEGNFWKSILKNGVSQLLKYSGKGELLQEFPRRRVEDGPFTAQYLLKGFDNSLWSVVIWYRESYDYFRHVLILDNWQPNDATPPRRFTFSAQDTTTIMGECISSYSEPGGKIWLGLDNGGLVVFDPRNESWQHYMHQSSDTSSLPNNRVYSILPDPREPLHTMWIGTSEGLARLDIESGTFTTFSTEEGLPNEVIYGILSDSRDNLWISTNQGLCCFDPRTYECQVYQEEDGLQHAEFNRRSFLKMTDGTLAFGGVGGLTWFDPEDLYPEPVPAEVVISGIRINNRPVPYIKPYIDSNRELLLKAPPAYSKEIELSYDNRLLTIEFAALDLTRPTNNRYRWNMEGLTDEWTQPSRQPEVTFTNLPPGSYTFQVRGCNYNGDWNMVSASIRVRVRPPWWGTWWFRTLLGLIVAMGIYALIRNRRRERQNLEALRNRISQDLHDEIGSTLSSISLFGTVADKSLREDPEKAHQLLKRINLNATNTIESMNDIVWAIKTKNDSMLHLVSRMRNYASELEDTGEWQITIHCDPELGEKNLDMIQRRNIYLIFKEAVNNAVKYSEGNAINIEIRSVRNAIRVEVRDNGKGFEPDKAAENERSFGGNGILNMRTRAEELGGKLQINSALGEGSSVILVFNPRYAPRNHWNQ